MSAGSGSSASTVRAAALIVTQCQQNSARFGSLRCDGHHLRSGQQQLQHGHQGGQLHQPPQRVPGPVQVHLDQQVLVVLISCLSYLTCGFGHVDLHVLCDWLQVLEDHLCDSVPQQAGRPG